MVTCLVGQSCVLVRKWSRADRYFVVWYTTLLYNPQHYLKSVTITTCCEYVKKLLSLADKDDQAGGQETY